MDPARLARARIRPARSEEDLARAAEFLRTPRALSIVEAHPEERGAVRLCEENGEILAAILLDPAPLRIRETDIRCARIVPTGGEDGREHFQKTGDAELFVLMLEEFLGYIWGRRYPLAYVHGELALYPSFGFVPCFYHPRIYLDVEAALACPSPYRVRHLKSEDARKIQAIRDQNQHWKPVVFATGVPMFHHFCVEAPNRKLKGYFSLEVNADATWNPRFFAPEIEVDDRAAAFTILRHCAQKAQEIGLEEIHFPVGPGHPIGRLGIELGGRSVMKGVATDPFLREAMIYVADPIRFVEALEGWCRQRLEAAGMLETSAKIPVKTDRGAWMLEIDAGAVSLRTIEKRLPKKRVDVPHWAFIQVLSGYRGVEDFDDGVPADFAELLYLLFPKTWPFSMPDPNHWRKIPDANPYSPAAAKVVEQVHLPWTGAW